ncbi:MAG TPA: glutathione S-transferase N-terminal domain-containing protein [Polyangiaceae bacterium]|jgi:glutathione S-transferase|nr:glutathione S-transferase N-terminal domain-containing protein [Polyangiaceae bacterium]
MLKVFGHPASTCTRKVLMTLAEIRTPYEMVTVDFTIQEHKKQPHLGRQPFGQIPAIDDDGFALYESRAICRYLSERYSGSLVPADIKARALMEQWISIETSNFTPSAMKFIYHDVFKRPQEPAVLETAAKSVDTALRVMDARLGESPFVAGPQLSLGDVCFMPYFEYAMLTPVKGMVAKFPHVSAWWSKVSERPTWQKAIGRA